MSDLCVMHYGGTQCGRGSWGGGGGAADEWASRVSSCTRCDAVTGCCGRNEIVLIAM